MNTIIRYRGDTAADRFTITRRLTPTADPTAVDITGCTFILTVNSDENPTDDTDQLFALTGAITGAVAGEVEFAPDATEADQPPGNYYYDVQMIDANGAILTVDKGRYRFKQDITKT